VGVIDQCLSKRAKRIDPSLYASVPQELTMAGKKPQDFTPHELFRRIDAQAISRDYRHKQAIFALGDKADAMFYVQNGNVKLTVASKNGKKAVIAILRQGDFFGEGCLVRQSMRVSSATAIQPSTIARVKKVSIVRLIHEDPAFVKLFISHLLSRIERIEEDFVDQIFSSSEKRLARILLVLAKCILI
jgi:CRP/FNR family transcriptional regulator, cyclic AMP receptor protein